VTEQQEWFGLEPPPILRDVERNIETEQLFQLEEQWHHYCQRLCAEVMVHEAAKQTENMSAQDAWNVFRLMPSPSLSWLYTPSGWACLITELRRAMGLDGPVPVITIH
jgi:hypothetical protein